MTAKRNPGRRGIPGNALEWSEVVAWYVARGQKKQAIQFLDDVMDKGDMPIFRSDADLEEQKRFAWRYKMDLLEEWDREKEALAWVCLECDLHPQNVEAAALKERLKRRVYEPNRDNGGGNRKGSVCPAMGRCGRNARTQGDAGTGCDSADAGAGDLQEISN